MTNKDDNTYDITCNVYFFKSVDKKFEVHQCCETMMDNGITYMIRKTLENKSRKVFVWLVFMMITKCRYFISIR